MRQVNIKLLTGGSATIPAQQVEELRDRLRGPLLLDGDAAFDQARTVWNAMIDRKPALVVRCAHVNDVMEAIRFARHSGAMTSIRGGGHNIAGNAVCDGGLMIDLSAMNSVRVDSANGRVRVEPGATLADLDRETAKFSLVIPTGINSTTGISGLALGGGFGWLSRRFGLTIDSLISADVVTSTGELIQASADENPDLFWALRGGGGNFGVVISFEFQAHSLTPDLLSGLVILPFERATELMKFHRELVASIPDELTVWAVLRKAPPLPFLPEEAHGKEIAILALCYAGDPQHGERAIAPLRAITDPIVVAIGVQPFAAWQQALDPFLTAGARNYWKSHDLLDMSDAAIGTIVAYAAKLPSDETEIFIAHLGGAVTRIGSAETAFAQRRPHFVMNTHTRWRDAADDDHCIEWTRSLFEEMKPHSSGVYVNFMPADESGRVGEAYGANFARLSKVKAKYDPDNFFRLNQNIQPEQGVSLAS